MSSPRMARISDSLNFSKSRPSKNISPPATRPGGATSLITESAVTDLPQPDSPTRLKVSPCSSLNETSSTERTSPRLVEKYVFRLRTSRRLISNEQNTTYFSVPHFSVWKIPNRKMWDRKICSHKTRNTRRDRTIFRSPSACSVLSACFAFLWLLLILLCGLLLCCGLCCGFLTLKRENDGAHTEQSQREVRPKGRREL